MTEIVCKTSEVSPVHAMKNGTCTNPVVKKPFDTLYTAYTT